MKSARIPASGQEYPIGKILCIGRNYVDHIHELGNEVPSAPVIFMKPATSVIGNGERIVIPPYSSDCHYEAELAVLIGRTGKNVEQPDALACVAGYGVAIDLTLRDVQAELKNRRRYRDPHLHLIPARPRFPGLFLFPRPCRAPRTWNSWEVRRYRL